MARWYGTTEERGLGAAHRAAGDRLRAQLRDGTPCWRCGQPMYRWQELDRDHITDRALGGAQGPAVLAHASCNRSAGSRLGNQLQPRAIAAAGRDTICRTCGKPYHYAARSCEICGQHYHPNHGGQRSCSRTCGVILAKRNRMARGWIPKNQRPKPPPRPRRQPESYAPRASITYYTCRYCGTLGTSPARGTRREVCPARECQLARLAANNLIARKGMTRTQADSAVLAYRAEGDHRGLGQRGKLVRRSLPHKCPACGDETTAYRWCDSCLCTSVNAHGRRCGNGASADGRCDYHAAQDATLTVTSRQW